MHDEVGDPQLGCDVECLRDAKPVGYIGQATCCFAKPIILAFIQSVQQACLLG